MSSKTSKTASTRCLTLIKQCEGFRPAPYLCPAGVPTIGYGNTRYPDGRAVTLNDPAITPGQAEALMLAALKPFEDAVNRYVQIELNQSQFDALVDFAYNAGPQALRNSTLLKLLNAGDFAGAADQFDVWVMAGDRRLPGLVKRRALEKQLFLTAS